MLEASLVPKLRLMRLSVAMATYNGEQFIAEQLQSIERQSRPPDELVVSDDGSADRTVQIVREFADGAAFNVVVLSHQERLGVTGNFFRAMRACTGDLIALSDQDDVWHRDKLSLCERPLAADPGVALVIHSAQAVDEHLRPIWSTPDDQICARKRVSAGSLRPFPRFRAGWQMLFRSCFAKAADVDQYPHFLSTARESMSHDHWVSVLCGAVGDIVFLPDDLVLFRRHPATATETWTGHHSGRTRRRGSAIATVREKVRPVVAVLELKTEADAYSARARIILDRATYLESLHPLAQQCGTSASSALRRTVDTHRRYAVAMQRRAGAYATDRALTRARAISRHAALGDYRSRSKGGLGFGSLARDVAIGLSRT